MKRESVTEYQILFSMTSGIEDFYTEDEKEYHKKFQDLIDNGDLQYVEQCIRKDYVWNKELDDWNEDWVEILYDVENYDDYKDTQRASSLEESDNDDIVTYKEAIKSYNTTNYGYQNNSTTVYGELLDGNWFVYIPDNEALDVYDTAITDKFIDTIYNYDNIDVEDDVRDDAWYDNFQKEHNITNKYDKEKLDNLEVELNSRYFNIPAKVEENKKLNEYNEGTDFEKYTRLVNEIKLQAEENGYKLSDEDIKRIADKMVDIDNFFYDYELPELDDIDNENWKEIHSVINDYLKSSKKEEKYRVYAIQGGDGVYNSVDTGIVDTKEQAEDRVAELEAETGNGAWYEEIDDSKDTLKKEENRNNIESKNNNEFYIFKVPNLFNYKLSSKEDVIDILTILSKSADEYGNRKDVIKNIPDWGLAFRDLSQDIETVIKKLNNNISINEINSDLSKLAEVITEYNKLSHNTCEDVFKSNKLDKVDIKEQAEDRVAELNTETGNNAYYGEADDWWEVNAERLIKYAAKETPEIIVDLVYGGDFDMYMQNTSKEIALDIYNQLGKEETEKLLDEFESNKEIKTESKEVTRQLQQNYKKTLERELDKVQKEIENAGPGDISGLEDRRDFLVDKIDQLESDLNRKEESKSTNYEIEYVIPNYTGGNIYVYTGKLKDGTYFMASDSMYDGDYFDTWFVNEDPDKVEDDGAWYSDWQEEHKTEKQITDDKEAHEFTIQLLNWIIKNKPEGNYAVEDMEDLLKEMNNKVEESKDEVMDYGEYYVKEFNESGTDMNTIGFDTEQEATDYARNEMKKHPKWEYAVYETATDECLYLYSDKTENNEIIINPNEKNIGTKWEVKLGLFSNQYIDNAPTYIVYANNKSDAIGKVVVYIQKYSEAPGDLLRDIDNMETYILKNYNNEYKTYKEQNPDANELEFALEKNFIPVFDEPNAEYDCYINGNGMEVRQIENNVVKTESVDTEKVKEDVEIEIYNAIYKYLVKERYETEESAKEYIDEYIVIDTKYEDMLSSYSEEILEKYLVVEIRAELDFNELNNMVEYLDKVVRKYDKNSYFDFVTSGIIRAYIQVDDEKLTESIDTNKVVTDFQTMDKKDIMQCYISDINEVAYTYKKKEAQQEIDNILNDLNNDKDLDEDDKAFIIKMIRPTLLNRNLKLTEADNKGINNLKVKRGKAKDYEDNAKMKDYYYVTIDGKDYPLAVAGWNKDSHRLEVKNNTVELNGKTYKLDFGKLDESYCYNLKVRNKDGNLYDLFFKSNDKATDLDGVKDLAQKSNELSQDEKENVDYAEKYEILPEFIYDDIVSKFKKKTESVDTEKIKEDVETEIQNKGIQDVVDTEQELKDGIKKEIYQYTKQQGLDLEKLRKQGVELDSIADTIDRVVGNMVSKSAIEYMDQTGTDISWDFNVNNNNIEIIIENL